MPLAHRLALLLLLAACRPAPAQAPAWRTGQAHAADEAACTAGEGEACFELGLAHQFGAVTEPNLARALELYDRACTLGRAEACTQAAGVAYHGVAPRDDARVRRFVDRACQLGHPTACTAPEGQYDGVILKDAIRAVVRGHLEQVRACYERGLAHDPALTGRVLLKFTIAVDGAVIDMAIAENLDARPEVGQCIADEARAWRFPAPFGKILVSYPFQLESNTPSSP